ncbi:MAG: tyrosine recombinase XerC [Ruminococcaceae bacterium]|nr:tyrosine recombinase XerC [Oscillospiraceae bacterium]
MPVKPRQEIDKTTLPGVLREFAGYKLGIENCSARTVEEYLLDLRTFLRYMIATRNGVLPYGDDFEQIDISLIDLEFVKNIKTEEIYEFLFYAGADRLNGWAAKARKLTSIKSFYKYLVTKRKVMEKNPAIDIDTPKKERKLPKYLSVDESLALLEAITSDTESKNIKRDFAIATLFLNCGMRLSELCGIDLRDIDDNLRSLRVFGKGAKERIIYLNAACQDALKEYLKVRNLNLDSSASAEPALFLSSRGNRISDKTVQWMIGKYLKIAGLESKGYSVHKLRHTAATLMYQSGNVDVRVLKDILGHEQLNTTQIYTHISDEQMESAMAQNPLAKVKAKKD